MVLILTLTLTLTLTPTLTLTLTLTPNQVDDAPTKAVPAPPAEACPVGAGGEAYPIGAKAE